MFVKYICVCMCMHSVVSDSVTPMDCSPLGTSVQGISQARMLEWVTNQGIKPTSLVSCVLCIGRRILYQLCPLLLLLLLLSRFSRVCLCATP